MWALIDTCKDDVVYLEASTQDMLHFRKWHRLSATYCYSRESTREELRDFITNMLLEGRIA